MAPKDLKKLDKSTGIGYLAPEILTIADDLLPDQLLLSDIWSLGLVFLETCLLEMLPIQANTPQSKMSNILNGVLEKVEMIYGKEFRFLLQSMLQYENNQRPSLEKLIQQIELTYFNVLTEKHYHKNAESLLKDIEELKSRLANYEKPNQQSSKNNSPEKQQSSIQILSDEEVAMKRSSVRDYLNL